MTNLNEYIVERRKSPDIFPNEMIVPNNQAELTDWALASDPPILTIATNTQTRVILIVVPKIKSPIAWHG